MTHHHELRRDMYSSVTKANSMIIYVWSSHMWNKWQLWCVC